MATAAAKTQTYTWQGTDRQGQTHSGRNNRQQPGRCQGTAAQAGHRRQDRQKESQATVAAPRRKSQPADIAIFARQLATMMKAGVPLVQSFDIVAEGLENPSMRDLVIEIKNEVASGTSLASSIAKHPKYFDDLFVSLVAAGEQAGTLETMLDRVATYKEKTEALKGKIKKAMTYPAAVVVVAVVVTGILLVKVVPQFAETFSSFGANLPAFTLMVLHLIRVRSGVVVHYSCRSDRRQYLLLHAHDNNRINLPSQPIACCYESPLLAISFTTRSLRALRARCRQHSQQVFHLSMRSTLSLAQPAAFPITMPSNVFVKMLRRVNNSMHQSKPRICFQIC